MAMAREAWLNALNAQLVKNKVGFISFLKLRGRFFRVFSETGSSVITLKQQLIQLNYSK